MRMKSLQVIFFLVALNASPRIFLCSCCSGNNNGGFAAAFDPVAQRIAIGEASAASRSSTSRRLPKHHGRSLRENENAARRITVLQRRHAKTMRFALPNQIVEGNNQPSDEKSTKSSGISNPCCQHQQVAILLPEPSNIESVNDDNAQWHMEATKRLEDISDQLGLPIIDNAILGNEAAAAAAPNHSHYLTAVSHPRTNSYALAMHHSTDSRGGGGGRNRNDARRKKKRGKIMKLDPLFVDLCPSANTRLGYRLNKGNDSSGELLIKALGAKKMLSEKNRIDGRPLIIYDLTAGLARDSLVILSSLLSNNDLEYDVDDGIPVRLHMVERDPIFATLLSDAVRRLDLLARGGSSGAAANYSETNSERRLSGCLSMERGDGVSVLNRLMSSSDTTDDGSTTELSSSSKLVPHPPDVIYLDPMFPPRKKKSSAVKKDMAMLHSLLGTSEMMKTDHTVTQDDAEEARAEEERALLAVACDFAKRRVVVKRPVGALPLGLPGGECEKDNNNGVSSCKVHVPKPSYDICGSTNRFDVYIIS